MKTYVTLYIESKWHSLNIEDPSEYVIDDPKVFRNKNVLITFQVGDLIREITATSRPLPTIVDLECFDRQMSQEGKEFRNYSRWKLMSFLQYHNEISLDFELTKDKICFLLEHIGNLFGALLNKDQVEKRRFIDLEVSVNALIHQRQRKGVRIDLEIAKEKCKELEREIYTIKNRLQLQYRIFQPDNPNQQLAYLESKKISIVKSIKNTFKVRGDDEVCKLFYELDRNEQDLDSCLFMLSHWGGSERTFPTYQGFGSITSRITMRQPALQSLRRGNRNVIIPDEGMKLLYIDYSQFEAGILASMSGDLQLIALYNSDIYHDLALNVLGDGLKRAEAKIVFYRYMYGDESLSESAKNYFKKFPKLNEFKQKIESEIVSNRKLGTSQGNYRQSLADQNSWALSHVIQSTASLIYKNALIRTRNEVRFAQFLIPMHDATLYQIRTLEYDYCKSLIEDIYKSEFKRFCPQIEPKVETTDKF